MARQLRRNRRVLMSFVCFIFCSALLETGEQVAVRIRHTGVLGLCAFISAYPYDIPDFVPEVFELLGANLNDPQPIPVSFCFFFKVTVDRKTKGHLINSIGIFNYFQSTIRKTVGDFKRTHIDNWVTYQAKFNENQLAVLTSIVPPSYYA